MDDLTAALDVLDFQFDLELDAQQSATQDGGEP